MSSARLRETKVTRRMLLTTQALTKRGLAPGDEEQTPYIASCEGACPRFVRAMEDAV